MYRSLLRSSHGLTKKKKNFGTNKLILFFPHFYRKEKKTLIINNNKKDYLSIINFKKNEESRNSSLIHIIFQ